MKIQKNIVDPSTAPATASIRILDEMAVIEKEFQKKRDEKKNELEGVRQELIAKLQKVDAYLGTNSFGTKASGEKGRRLKKGELEKYIKDALSKGPATIGEILKRIHEAGLLGKDGSIRSKVGSPKWVQSNGIVRNGDAYTMKK
jgi:hypothetical protein